MSLTPEMIAAGWIEHDGGPCPIDANVAVQVQCASGVIGWVHVSNLRWLWSPEDTCGSRIIAYKPESPSHD